MSQKFCRSSKGQRAWLKNYISFNSLKRAQAKTEFEKYYFRLMVNLFFGKSLENLKGGQNTQRWISKTNFLEFRIFNKNLVTTHSTLTRTLIRIRYLNRKIKLESFTKKKKSGRRI